MATGNRTTVAFSSGFTARTTMVDPGEQSRASLADSDLLTEGYEKFIPGDLVDPGELQLEFFYDPDGPRPAVTGVEETITITYRPPAGKTNGATHVGKGFVTKWKPGSSKNNEQIQGGAVWKWSGAPAYTPAS